MSKSVAEMVEWLKEKKAVKKWKMAKSFDGFKILEVSPVGFSPETLPDGWEVISITSDSVYIRQER